MKPACSLAPRDPPLSGRCVPGYLALRFQDGGRRSLLVGQDKGNRAADQTSQIINWGRGYGRSVFARTHTILDRATCGKCSKPSFGFWLPFGLPTEFFRGLTGANSRCADKQNELSWCADKQNELSWCADKQNKHSRCADKLTNKINSADMQPIKVKGAHLLAIKTNSYFKINR